MAQERRSTGSSYQSLSESSIYLNGRRISFDEFCSQDYEELEQLRNETIEQVLLAMNYYHVLGLSMKDRHEGEFETKVKEKYLELSMIVHPAKWQVIFKL